MRFRVATALLLGLLCSPMAGCQRSAYEVVPVRGRVTLERNPLPMRAKVMFAPVESANNVNPGKPAFGILQADGSFQLTTYEMNDGAIVGEHWVTIISLAEKTQAPAAFSRLTLPQRVKVDPNARNEFTLDLNQTDVQKFGVLLRD